MLSPRKTTRSPSWMRKSAARERTTNRIAVRRVKVTFFIVGFRFASDNNTNASRFARHAAHWFSPHIAESPFASGSLASPRLLKAAPEMRKHRRVVISSPGENGLNRRQARGQRTKDQPHSPDLRHYGDSRSDSEPRRNEPHLRLNIIRVLRRARSGAG